MKLTENTKVRVKVPKHLYEAIQAELDKKHGMEEGHYGEKEMEEAESQTASLEEIAAAMDKALAFAKKLGKQIADKKDGSLTQKDQSRLVDNFRSKVREFSPLKPQMDESYEDNMEEGEEINEYVGINPADYDMVTLMGLGLPILTALLAVAKEKLGPKVANAIKSAIAKKKGEKQEMNEYVGINPADYDMVTLMGLGLPILTALLAVAKEKFGPKVASAISAAISKKKGGEETPDMEEALDLETLMEAVKDASKKKAAKKIAYKKVEDEKKKKEAKIAADKKAAMEKKKAVAAKKK